MSEHSGHHTVHAETAVKPDLVTAVFVTFNSHSVIGDALRATQGCREVSHVIVVDNASTDQTVELIESEFPEAIRSFGARAQKNQISLEELEGGTFTITNGGVYGSLLSTPIVNPPQSGVLGMHGIVDRPVALNGEVVIRPMMYVALTYDHRKTASKHSLIALG